MTTLTGDPGPFSAAAGAGPLSRSGADRRWDRFRYALLAGWLVVAGATPLLGERHAAWDDVTRLVTTGEVSTVRISAELPAGSTGYGIVGIEWRKGLLRYQADVLQVRGRGEHPGDARSGDDDITKVLRTSPSGRLAALQPGLRITHGDRQPMEGRLLWWRIPTALSVPVVLLILAGLVLLVAGPEPWRATRWAWFWLLLPPVGGVAFLLLSGPTPRVPHRRAPSRRLTGGWALLLALALSALVPHHWP